MNYLSKEEARKLALRHAEVMSFFKAGYSEALHLTNDKVMNDPLVRPNDYFVNDDFASNPTWSVAHFGDRIYRVLRVIYVRPDHRSQGVGTEVLRAVQSHPFKEHFLQIGVQATSDERYNRLDTFYRRLGFKSAHAAVDHGNGRFFRDYFWAPKEFGVQQKGSLIAPYFL